MENSETNKNSTYQITVNKKVANTYAEDNSQLKKANKIRTIGLIAFIIVALSVIIFLIVRHKKLNDDSDEFKYSSEEDDEDEEEIEDNDNIEFKDDRINLNEDEELFRRVNKSKFAPLEDTKKTKNSEDTSPKSVLKDDKEKSDIFENYFKNIDSKRKGKNF